MARLEASDARGDTAKVLDRCALTARARVCALVGDALAQAGIDQTCASSFQLAPHPDPLPASGAREQSAEFAARDSDGLAGRFAAKIGDMARRYHDGCEPDFARTSSAELFAWCLARQARSVTRPT